MKRSSLPALFAGLALLALPGSEGCGLHQSSGAAAPGQQPQGYATATQCPSFSLYQIQVEPIVQQTCLTCHAPGGQGSPFLQLNYGILGEGSIAAANFFLLRAQAVPSTGLVDPNSASATSPLLERLTLGLPHPLTLAQSSSEYQSFSQWVVFEAQQTCLVDPTTGAVTIN